MNKLFYTDCVRRENCDSMKPDAAVFVSVSASVFVTLSAFVSLYIYIYIYVFLSALVSVFVLRRNLSGPVTR